MNPRMEDPQLVMHTTRRQVPRRPVRDEDDRDVRSLECVGALVRHREVSLGETHRRRVVGGLGWKLE